MESGRCNRYQETSGSDALVAGSLCPTESEMMEEPRWQWRLFYSRQPDVRFMKVVDSMQQFSWGLISLRVRDHLWNVEKTCAFQRERRAFSPMNKPLTSSEGERPSEQRMQLADKRERHQFWPSKSSTPSSREVSSGLAPKSKARRDFLLRYHLTGLPPLLCGFQIQNQDYLPFMKSKLDLHSKAYRTHLPIT